MLASGNRLRVLRPGTDDATVRTLPEAPSGATSLKKPGISLGISDFSSKSHSKFDDLFDEFPILTNLCKFDEFPILSE